MERRLSAAAQAGRARRPSPVAVARSCVHSICVHDAAALMGQKFCNAEHTRTHTLITKSHTHIHTLAHTHTHTHKLCDTMHSDRCHPASAPSQHTHTHTLQHTRTHFSSSCISSPNRCTLLAVAAREMVVTATAPPPTRTDPATAPEPAQHAAELITSRVHARVGLLGNPSDGYNGQTISFALANFWAEVCHRRALLACEQHLRGEDQWCHPTCCFTQASLLAPAQPRSRCVLAARPAA